MSATLKFHGHSCFSMAADGRRVIIDPFLEGNPQAVEGLADVGADVILATHAHSDHLGDSIDLAKRTGALLIATYELAVYCGRQGVPNVRAMHIGGTADLGFARVKLTVAHHSSSIVTDDSIQMLGAACGFIVTMGGRSAYHLGDTGLAADMELIGRLHDLDAAMIPIGSTFTMDLEDGILAAKMIGAKLSIPMHYDTFPVIEADPHEFVRRVGAEGLAGRVMQPGEEIELP